MNNKKKTESLSNLDTIFKEIEYKVSFSIRKCKKLKNSTLSYKHI